MSDQDSKPYHHDISLDDEGPIDWASALKELEGNSPPVANEDMTPIPRIKSTPESETAKPMSAAITRSTTEGRSKYQDLVKKRAVTISEEDLKTLDELAEILSSVNIANSLLEGFIKHHPEAVPERLLHTWRYNLRETSQIMMREFHQLRHGKDNKSYDPRTVCTVCHTVYLSPLPDGVCDECRANTGGRAEGAY